MSKISLKHSGGNAVSLNSPTNAPGAADVAFKLPNADGSDGQAIVTDGAGNLSFANAGSGTARNLIINGSFLIAQRGVSSTTNGHGSVDRFSVDYGNTDEAPTQAQGDVASGTTPYTLGFRKCLKITNGNQTSGAGAGDYLGIEYYVEAQDMANSGWNYTSSSSNVTLSFYIKSSVAQSFKGFVRTRDGTEQRFPFDTGSLSADTWTKVTKTISGNSNLQFDNNNDKGLQIVLAAFWGTDYTDNSITENAWSAYASGTRMKDNTSTWYTTNDATLEITGVQLEVGSVATDFEHRSFGQELTLCQRYFYLHTDAQTNSGQEAIGTGTWYNGYNLYVSVHFPTTMRTVPSLYQVSGTDYFLFNASNTSSGFDSFNEIWRSNKNMAFLGEYNESNTQGASAMIQTNNTNARLGFNAEL